MKRVVREMRIIQRAEEWREKDKLMGFSVIFSPLK